LIVHPRLVEFSVQPIRENWYIFFIAALVFVLCEAVRKSTVLKWGACGIFLGLSTFSRLEAMEFFPVAALILLFLVFFKKISLKEMLLSGIALCLTFGATALLVLWGIDFDSRFLSMDLAWNVWVRLLAGWLSRIHL